MEREGLQNSRVCRLRFWYASSYESCLELSNTVKLDLTLAGIMIQKKSIWELQNYIEWFGFFLDMFRGTLTIPSHKVNKLAFGQNNIYCYKICYSYSFCFSTYCRHSKYNCFFQQRLGMVCLLMTIVMHMNIDTFFVVGCSNFYERKKIKTDLSS